MEAGRISTHTIRSSLRHFLHWSTLPCIFCVLVLATACSSSTAPRNPTRTKNPAPVLTATHTPEPSPVSVTPTDTIPPTLEPPDWLIEEDSFSISINWTEDETPSEQVTLVIPEVDLGFNDWDDPPIFDYLSWSGTRGRLFEIEYHGNLDLKFPIIFDLPPAANRFIAFGIGDLDSLALAEIYWIDIQTRQVFGYNPPCKSITTVGEDALAIGPEWFAYVCDEDQTTWHLFSLEDPSNTLSFQLPYDKKVARGFEPSWLDANTLTLNHRARPINRCIVHLVDPSEPIVACQEFDPDITLGRFSPDGNLMEVRVSTDTTYLNPQEIGVIKTACFSSSLSCFPHLCPSPFGSEAGGGFLEDGAWLPDSSGILYVQLQSINSAWADKTYLWTFDLHQQIFTQIAYLDDPLVFYQDYNQSAPIWSPDETSVLLQNFSKIYAFDLTDATLQLLNDDGGIAIGAVVLP